MKIRKRPRSKLADIPFPDCVLLCQTVRDISIDHCVISCGRKFEDVAKKSPNDGGGEDAAINRTTHGGA